MLKKWFLFIDQQRAKQDQRRKAVRHHYLLLLRKHLNKWKTMYNIKYHGALQLVFNQWKNYTFQKRRKTQKMEKAKVFRSEKLISTAFSLWRLYHIKYKETKIKNMCAIQHWALSLQGKTYQVICVSFSIFVNYIIVWIYISF